MKFGKLLKTRADDMGELGIGEHFLRYKALKKQLKEMQNMDPANGITSVFLPVWLLPMSGICGSLVRMFYRG